MANIEHLAILKKGVEGWNAWQAQNREIKPDLSEADLSRANLRAANLSMANLRAANLHDANLHDANLTVTDLRGADLLEAELGAADLSRANLRRANLRGADLSGANLSDAKLGGAKLGGAKLARATLVRAKLGGADLVDACLIDANLLGANLLRANLKGALLGMTTFASNDLHEVIGLDEVRHLGPSTIGIDTIFRSEGNIPEVFLRGAGVPEAFIVQMKSLVGAMEPIQFYSCFISYSSKDGDFAERLHADLQCKNVRCWFAPEDMKIGDRIRPRIDEAIRKYDKLLLVLTENSISSTWVEKEVEAAFEKERLQGRTVLFPIRLDDAVMQATEAWAADIRRTRHIGDFSGWKEHDKYKAAFDRLMRDLKAEDAGTHKTSA
jgi:hypothetical protein